MGWNSWDCYGTAVAEKDVKANADFMADRLARFGWQYVVVDIQWYRPDAKDHGYDPNATLVVDDFGRLQPAENRFPSAAGGAGFKALADYVHGKGLKFGIHIMRGIPRVAVERNLPIKGAMDASGAPIRAADIAETDNVCRWNPDMYGVDTTKPGAQAYYDSIVDLYAGWGVDFIKADDMASHLYQPAEIKALHKAILKSGRPIVLSLSPGPAPAPEAAFFQRHAQMWRVSDDFWDDWRLLKQEFSYARDWEAEIGKDNTWPDADMLAIGKLRLAANGGKGEDSKFTRDEQRTMLSLWSIIRSPLMMGGDLPRSDEFAISLLSNPEVIEVNQRSSQTRHALDKKSFVFWAGVMEGGDVCLGAFNLADKAGSVSVSWDELGLAAKRYAVRDLWARSDCGVQPKLTVKLPAHASALFRLSAR